MALNRYLLKGTAVGALGGLLFGFDTAVISGTIQTLTSLFQLTHLQVGITVSSALAGTVIGAMFAGIPGEKYGSRETLRVLAVFYILSALGCALAPNWTALLVFRFLGGLGIGGSSVLCPVYISELAPSHLHGRLVGSFQINIVIGILLAYLSNAVLATLISSPSLWRWEFGVAAFPAILFFAFLFGIPQSARWLATRGRNAEARSVLDLLETPNAEAELQAITQSIQSENLTKSEPLFQAKYSTPIFLAITIGMFNQLAGINAILYYLNDIFAAAGFTQLSGNVQAVIIGAMNLTATLLAMTVIDKLGRKTLLLFGSVGMFFALAGVAAIFYTHSHAAWLVWLLTAYIFFFATSQGAVIWVYISEVSPNLVRAKGQALGSSSHWIMNFAISLVFPLMAARSGAAPFVFFAVMMVVQFFIVLTMYPETKGASLEQLQKNMGIH